MSAIDVVEKYGQAVGAGDMGALAAVLAEDAVWHQPGENQFSGDHLGPAAIIAHLGRLMQASGGTFALEPESVTESGDLVSMTVRFTAHRPDGATLDQHGVDVFRVADERIAEIWLIGEDQAVEDAFWG